MTAARKIADLTEDEFRALIREELGGRKVDAPKKPEVRSKPPAEAYEYVRRLRNLSPYGAPGDRLWVREAWRAHAALDHLAPRDIRRGAA